MKIIDIKNCNVYLESKKILSDFALEINEFEHLAIIGPNGSGKSTLIRLLTQDIYPSHAEKNKPKIKILNQNNWNIFELRHKISAISTKLESAILDAFPLNIFDAVASSFFGTYGFFAGQKANQKQILSTNQTLKKLGLFAIKNQMINELSTGQLRKVLIARAMVLKPKIILLDEPASGLDVVATYDFIKFLEKIHNDTTIILVTHHLEEIMPQIEKVLLIKEGKIFLYGKKEEILTEENLSELFEAKIKLQISKDKIYSMRRLSD